MKRCPQCNRLYSDITPKCPQCGISLSGGTNSTNNSKTAYQQPQNTYHQQNEYDASQGSYQKSQNYQQSQNTYRHHQESYRQSDYARGQMGFGEAISTCFKKYVDPKGRARRSEYWYFYLFYIIVAIVTSFIDTIMGVNLLFPIAYIAFLCPSWCAMVRRYHDVGKKWTFCFWAVIPLYGWYKVIVALVKDSEPGSNMYGPCPK